MPFFENARDFKIEKANFIEVGGDQNNYHHDQSLKVSGENNSATYNKGPQYHDAASVNVAPAQINQSMHQRSVSHTSTTPLQSSTQPQIDSRTTAQNNASLNIPASLASASAPTLTGSISGTTLAQSPQAAYTTSPPTFPSPSSTPAAPPTTDAPTSAGQSLEHAPVLPEFPELKLRRGATLENAGKGEGKGKKKKKNFFSRMFRKAPKKTDLAATGNA